MQRALGLLVACVLLLLSGRWYTDCARPRPVEVHHDSFRVELNRASRAELLQLPGVGPNRVDKILAYRSGKGGFQNVEDLKEVEGIGEITWQRLRPHIQVGTDYRENEDEPLRLQRKPVTTGRLNLNQASVEELEGLPGIGKTLAQRIVDEREKKPFASINDLRRVSGIGAKRLEQVRAFVNVQP